MFCSLIRNQRALTLDRSRSLRSVQACVALSLAFLAFSAPRAVAQDSSAFSSGFETAVRSGHSDRGFLISDRAVVQPVLWAAWKRTSGYVWSNVALASASDGTRPGIVEGELSQGFEWKGISMTPAARMYFYYDPLLRSRSRSLETWLNLTRDIGALTLFTRHSLDLLDNRGREIGRASCRERV